MVRQTQAVCCRKDFLDRALMITGLREIVGSLKSDPDIGCVCPFLYVSKDLFFQHLHFLLVFCPERQHQGSLARRNPEVAASRFHPDDRALHHSLMGPV